jgi:hypothetical protein
MNCRNFSCAEVCYIDTDGNQQTMIAHYEYGVDAAGATILVSTRYTDAAGVPVDTSGGTVKAGGAPVSPPDVEWIPMCDALSDGSTVNYLCRSITTFAADGTPTNVKADFELDKTTAYTVQGTPKPQGACPPATAQGLLTAWG